MKSKIITTLTIITTILGVESAIQAKPPAPKPNSGTYTLSGNSLIGVNNRTAQQDFGRFFSPQNSLAISDKNATANISPEASSVPISNQVELRRNIDQPLTSPNSLIFPQGDRAFDANNGFQVQVQGQ